MDSDSENQDESLLVAENHETSAGVEGPGLGGIIQDKQLAYNYPDSLELEYVGKCQLDVPTQALESYRNNLSAFSDENCLLFTAMRSVIAVFGWNPVAGMPHGTPKALIDATPLTTTLHHLNGANWPAYPHSINFLKLAKLRGKEVLLVAVDDSRVVAWHVEDLAVTESNERCRLDPLFEIQTSMSAWGVDLHEQMEVLAVSDNSRQAFLYRLGPFLDDGQPLEVSASTPKLPHNVPDVQFVQVEDSYSDRDTVHLACISILRDVVFCEVYLGERLLQHQHSYAQRASEYEPAVFEVQFLPLEEDQTDYTGKEFRCGKIIYREAMAGMSDMGWTITALQAKDFKHVQSLAYATGSFFTNEDPLLDKYQNENENLMNKLTDPGLQINPLSESLYPSCRFSWHEIKTNSLHHHHLYESLAVADNQNYYISSSQNRQEKKRQYLRTHKNETQLFRPPFLNQFFFCTGKTSVALCRVEDFYCNAAQDNVFKATLPSRNRRRRLLQGSGPMDIDDDANSNGDGSDGYGDEYGNGNGNGNGTEIDSSNVLGGDIDEDDDLPTPSRAADRMSLVLKIPEISVLVVASQVGLVSVFRLVRYRGIYCIRQEYVFPEPDRIYWRPEHMLVGLSSKRLADDKYQLILTQLDGTVQAYNLHRKVAYNSIDTVQL